MHRFDQIEPSARLWFGRGLFIYALGNLLLFTGIGFAVASFFQFALSEDWKDPNLRNIVLTIEFIISWVYFLLLKDAIEGYTAPAESYTRLITLCRTLASRTVCLTQHGDIIMRPWLGARASYVSLAGGGPASGSSNLVRRSSGARQRPETDGLEEAQDGESRERSIPQENLLPSRRPLATDFVPDSPYTEYRALGKTTVSGEGTQLVLAPGVSEQDVRVALYHVRDACMAIVWYSFRLYQPQDHQALSIRHTEVRRGAGGAVPQPAQLHPVERLMHDHEGDVLVMLTLLVDFIGYNIGRLSHLDEINTSAHNLINQAYVELSKQVNDTEVATFVRTPRIFKQHLFFVMAVFLLVWTPFSMWLTLSWGVTVVFYPILIYLLAGPFIYRSFVGESFDPDSRGGLMDHSAQRREGVNSIRNLFDPQYSVLRYTLPEFASAPPLVPPRETSQQAGPVELAGPSMFTPVYPSVTAMAHATPVQATTRPVVVPFIAREK